LKWKHCRFFCVEREQHLKKHIVIIACVKGISRATPRTPPAGPGGRKTINERGGVEYNGNCKGDQQGYPPHPPGGAGGKKNNNQRGGLELMETVKIIKEYI